MLRPYPGGNKTWESIQHKKRVCSTKGNKRFKFKA